ncbi:MAG: ribonuclease III [Cellulosilyticum sp.]|nr:ribonuclease III [Cellulosilyticum sp.]
MSKKVHAVNKHEILENMQQVLHYTYKNHLLLEEALTHSSYANEHRNQYVRDNERLEFLGDAILDLIISEYLFKKYADMPEGDLSKIRASIVCEGSLAKMARKMNLGQFILLGKGEELTGGRERASILADAFEAITGSLFLDGGFDQARSFIHETLVEAVEQTESIENLYADYKTLLQECIQKVSMSPIHYEVVGEEGPDHDKHFYVEVLHEERLLGRGIGKSKKEAEQDAAKKALKLYNS